MRNGLFLEPLEGRWLPAPGFYISSLQNFDRTNLHFSKSPWFVRHCHNGPRTKFRYRCKLVASRLLRQLRNARSCAPLLSWHLRNPIIFKGSQMILTQDVHGLELENHCSCPVLSLSSWRKRISSMTWSTLGVQGPSPSNITNSLLTTL